MKALITGVTGQDGSYLAQYLLQRGFSVDGLVRRTSTNNNWRIAHLHDLNLIEGDLSDSGCMASIIGRGDYDYIYHLGAMSHVGTSYTQPSYTFNVNANGSLHILEAVRQHSKHTKIYMAGTSEEFGNTAEIQSEHTELDPRSPYAVSKVAMRHLGRVYRDSYDMFVCTNWLFNHESPRRGETFVTRKITKYIADTHALINGEWDLVNEYDDTQLIYRGRVFPKLHLGNLSAYRDWGYAFDYVRAMVLTLESGNPDEYVVATGKCYTVEDFLRRSFNAVGVNNPNLFVYIDPVLFRPCEVHRLQGDSSKIRKQLGWTPLVDFDELVRIMVWSDINGKEVYPQNYQTEKSEAQLR